MRLYILEGSPEELSGIVQKLEIAPEKLAGFPSADGKSLGATVEKPWVTADQARVILSRRPLSDVILKTLRALYAAGPKRLASADLKKITGLDAHEFRGMLGAFGRRVGHTAPNDARFLDQKWDHNLGEYTWSLPEAVRQAMRELKLVN